MDNLAARIVVVIVFFPTTLFAQIVITEVMYDPEGIDLKREWIEVHNEGSETVPPTAYSILENGKKHGIVGGAGGNSVPARAFAVIADNPAQFRLDHPTFVGLLFDSAFSLSNRGEEIAIVDSHGIRTAARYTDSAADGSGDSWQRIGAADGFEAGIPSPGEGIPATGLRKAPGALKKSSVTKGVHVATALPAIVGAVPTTTSESLIIERIGSPWYVWLAPLIISVFASAGIVVARVHKKDEWEIIEDLGDSR